MPQVGLEPTIPVLELKRTVYALEGATTMISGKTPIEYSMHPINAKEYSLHLFKAAKTTFSSLHRKICRKTEALSKLIRENV
jgi:hypothetical protein